MGNVLGGLNYDATLGSQDYTAYRNLLENEILVRFLLSAGFPPNPVAQTGIVDSLNPAQISTSETTRPFLIRVSTINAMDIQINPGVAVTPSGAVIRFAGTGDFKLARILANDINVVYVQNQLISGGTTPLNDYQEALATQEVQNPSVLGVALLADFQNPSLFPVETLTNLVVLGVVSVVPTANSGLALQIDMSQSIYDFNRPWFSVHATQHESEIGSAPVTAQNPHGTSFNEVAPAGNVGLFQGLSNSGLIVSRDVTLNKMPGSTFCTESIPLSRIQTDTNGTVTAGSPYGGVGAQYILLLTYPTRLGSIYETGIPQNSIAGELIENTNILVLGPHEVILNPLTVEYTQAQALVPPVNPSTNQLVFTQPATNEAIVSGGLTFSSIPNNILTLDGSGPYPRTYKIYCLSDKSLAILPQILQSSITLDSIGSSLYSLPISMLAPARIAIGLTKATNVSGMQVQIQVVGVDETGAQASETITISNAGGYVDETVPSVNYDSPNQVYLTSQVFGAVQTIQVLSRTNDGPHSEIQIWAEAEPGTAPTLNDIAEISTVKWNGQGIAQCFDTRTVSKSFVKPEFWELERTGNVALDAARLASNLTNPALLSGASYHLITEDIEDIRYFDSVAGLNPFVQATGMLTIGNVALVQAGDTFTIAPGKTIVAVTGSPNTAVGQFQISGSLVTIMQNIVTTINDPTFNSGVFAELGTGANIDLTYNTALGALGNAFTITRVAASGGIQVTGYSRGYDKMSECYLSRNVIGLKSGSVPADSDLYAYGYQYRNRYRSRAIAIPDTLPPLQAFAILLYGEDPFQPKSIRIRGSDHANPSQWLPWQVLSAASPGYGSLYIATISAPAHKVQVELYGRLRGYSLYALVPNP